MAQCRFCKDEGFNLLKYSVRHYAHHQCYLQKFGAAGFEKLPLWKLKIFPYAVIHKMDLETQLEAAIKAKEGRS